MHDLRLQLPPTARRRSRRAARAASAVIGGLIAIAMIVPIASPASASTTLFSDGFESGTFGAWSSVVTANGGSAWIGTSPVKSGTHAAGFYATTSSGSVAYIRKTLSAAQANLTVSLDIDVTAEGPAGWSVPIVTLYTWTGNRIVSLYRQNQTGGQVWLQDQSSYLKTSGIVPLNTWTHVDFQVAPTGSSSATWVAVNGATVWSANTNLGVDWPATVQLGSNTGGAAFTAYADNVTVSTGGSTSPTASPTPSSSIAPAPTASSTPPPTSSGWKNVINDQFGSLSSIPSHWTLYNGRYGDTPGNCAIPSHDGVWSGLLHLQMYWQSSGICGAAWYTGGMKLSASYGSIDQRITLSFRVVNNGAVSHYIIPMRWPTTASWPSGGEEDYCERDAALGSCATFLHYGTNASTQIYHGFNPDLSQWHTLRAQRQNHVVTLWLDNMSTPVWTYYGSSTTLPDTVKTVVLQQECLVTGCPSTTSGSEDLQISWITVDNPS